MNFGICEGGPFHGKRMPDERAVFRVAIDNRTGKYLGPVQGPNGNPDLRFGEYRFYGSYWVWHPELIA